jgi:hypothetical protein
MAGGISGAVGNVVRVVFEAVTTPFTQGARTIVSSLFNIQANGAQTGRTLRNTMDELNASTRRAHSSLGSLGSMLGALFTAYAGRKLFDLTVGQAANFEYYELQYKILLGGMEKAQQRMEELNKFNLFTPFQLEEIIKADKLLTAFGIRSSQALKTIGDAAAGAGQPIEDVSFWMGRIAAGDVGFGLMRLSEMSIVTRKQLEDMGLKFGKNNEYLGDFNLLMDKLFEHMQKKYPNAMNELSGTAKGMYSNMMDAIGLFGREIGTEALDSAKEAMQSLIEKIWELKNNGTMEEWAQNIGNVISYVISWVIYLIDHIDEIVNTIGRVALWIQTHLSTIIFWVRLAVEAWIAWRLAIIATNVALHAAVVISIIIGFVRTLITTMSIATAVQWAWNAAMNANPIGVIITLVGMLIFAIIQLWKNWDTAKYYILIGINVLLVGFFGLLEGIMWVVNKIAEAYNFLYGWIPGIGKVTEAAVYATGQAFDFLAGKVENAKNRILEYRDALDAAKASENAPSVKAPDGGPSPLNLPTIPGTGPVPKMTGLGGRKSGGGGAGQKKDAVDKLEDKYKNLLKEYENLADAAEKKNDLSAWQTSLKNLKDVLTRKIGDLNSVIRRTTGDIQEKARAERAEALKKLAEIDKDISEKTTQFIEKQYENRLKVAENKANIAENESKRNGFIQWRTALYGVIKIYKDQLQDVNKILQSATGKLKEEAEARKYELLKKISDVTKDIREKINNLVEEFNAPSGVDATSLLQYQRSQFTNDKGFVISDANFVFQVQKAPTSEKEWKETMEMSESALSNFLDNRRRRGGKG